jgi:hypothetical protein
MVDNAGARAALAPPRIPHTSAMNFKQMTRGVANELCKAELLFGWSLRLIASDVLAFNDGMMLR